MTNDEDRRRLLANFPAKKIRVFSLGEDSPEAEAHKSSKSKRTVSARTKAHIARGVARRKKPKN